MRRVALGISFACSVAACEADLPTLTDAHSELDATCKGPYADLLVDFYPSSLANASAALGAPDNNSVSLATDSVITVGFVGLGGVTDASGPDLRIHATVAPGASATVRVAGSDMVFSFAGNLTATTGDVDIAVSMLTFAIYVRIVDVMGAIDVDAIEATHDKCR